MSNNIYWKKILDEKPNGKLIFIHTPKCGGTYVNSILTGLNIINRGHHQAVVTNNINFTVFRHPVSRFQSLLNYRLSHAKPLSDWPTRLHYVYKNEKISLNEIVSKMTNAEILGFIPYKTLTYWSQNIDIFITIDQLDELLLFFGHVKNDNIREPLNISSKKRGDFNTPIKQRIERVFKDDIELFNKVTTIT